MNLSCPDLIRASTHFASGAAVRAKMDGRDEPGHDDK
jgi:hypothetical protein